MPKFCANLSLLFTELPFLDRFAAAARAGFSAVECQFPYALPATAIAEALQYNRLRMVLFNLPAGNWEAGERGIAVLPQRVAEFRAGVERAIEYAQTLDCHQCNALAGIPASDCSVELAERTLIENLHDAAERLQAAGIRLLLEPLNTHDVPGFFVNRAAQAMRLIDGVAHDNLFLQHDVYHAARMGDDPAAILATHPSRIAHLQIADCPGRHEPGSGGIDFRALFEQIDRSGYPGWIGAEYIPRAGTEAGLSWYRAELARSASAPVPGTCASPAAGAGP